MGKKLQTTSPMEVHNRFTPKNHTVHDTYMYVNYLNCRTYKQTSGEACVHHARINADGSQRIKYS